jgi:hypothetical protein
MVRKLSVQYRGAIYHVMSRGNRREDISWLMWIDRISSDTSKSANATLHRWMGTTAQAKPVLNPKPNTMTKSILLIFLTCIGFLRGFTADCLAEEKSKVLFSKDRELQFKIEIITEAARAGEAFWINIKVINVSQHNIEYLVPANFEGFRFEMFYGNAQLVPYTSWGGRKVSDKVFHANLAPGSSRNCYVNVSRVFDCSLDGTYRLKISKEDKDLMPQAFEVPIVFADSIFPGTSVQP